MKPLDDELYATPPAEFVATRNRLAADLKKAGRAADAAAVKALPKPTASVWAVNQLARLHGDAVQAFVDATRAALEAAGGGAAGAAIAAQRDRMAELVDAALEVLDAHGLAANATNRDRITNDLRAAALSPELRQALLAGRLQHDLEPGGFDALVGQVALAPAARHEAAAAAPARDPRGRDDHRAHEARVAELRRTLAVARRDAGEARRQRERAQAAEASARAALEAARAELARAERASEAAARTAAEARARDAERAAEVDRLERELSARPR